MGHTSECLSFAIRELSKLPSTKPQASQRKGYPSANWYERDGAAPAGRGGERKIGRGARESMGVPKTTAEAVRGNRLWNRLIFWEEFGGKRHYTWQ